MPDLAVLAASVRELLPRGTAVAATDPQVAGPPIWPDEAIEAVPKRLMEFAAGRTAVRLALAELGEQPQAVPVGPDRAPIWPEGVSGSITHSASACLAAVIRAPRLIGLDLEPDTPLEGDLWETVLRPEERDSIRGRPDASRLAKLIFSAKEATYKAQYARSKALFGFDALSVILGRGSFEATFGIDVPGFAEGTTLNGRYCLIEGHFLTAVII